MYAIRSYYVSEAMAALGVPTTRALAAAETEADFDVLVWSDIVRVSMERNIPQTYALMVV